MPGLVPGIHVFARAHGGKDVDGRDEPGHDDVDAIRFFEQPQLVLGFASFAAVSLMVFAINSA